VSRPTNLASLARTAVVAVAALAGGSAPVRGEEPAGPPATVRPIAGSAVAGTLSSLGPDGIRLATAAGERRWSIGDLISIRLGSEPGGAPTRALRLRTTLVGGEVLVGRAAAPESDHLVLDGTAAGTVRVPLEAVRSVEALPADAGPCQDAAHRHPARPGSDAVFLRSGDEFTGTMLDTEVGGFRFDAGRGVERSVAWEDLLLLVLDNPPPERSEADGPGGVSTRVETRDGGVLAIRGVPTSDADGLAVILLSCPAELRVPWRAVEGIEVRTGRWAWAGDLSFESEFVPYYDAEGEDAAHLARWFGARVDRRPSGCPLTVAGRVSRRGFGVHSRSRISIRLDGRFERFEGAVGIDDEEPDAPPGSVDARVLVDDRVAFEAKAVTRGAAARAIGPIDLTGARVLVLEVDYGPGEQVMDRADWLEPLLVRAEPGAGGASPGR
jgi:hypothetical protein